MRRLAAVLLVLGACHGHGQGGASCRQVATAFLTIARSDASHATLDDGTRRALDEQLPAMRDALANACSDGGWSAAVRDCMAKAGDHAALQTCEEQLTDAQRRALHDAASGPGGMTKPHGP